MENCVFCKIAKREIPAEFLYEDDYVVAFRDTHPIAPVHVLVIPKKHVENIADLDANDEVIAGRLIMAAKKIAEDLKISDNGYKLLFRVGEYGGQEVGHLHLHLLGGARLSEDIKPISQ
jgi:histidine triad (HIT) family protein